MKEFLTSLAHSDQRKKKVIAFIEYVERFHFEEATLLLLGGSLCFAGGCFSLTICVVEAFLMTGWAPLKASFQTLLISYHSGRAALERAEKTGWRPGENATRDRLFIVLSAVDPDKLSNAGRAIFSGLLAAYSALQLEFARVLTLGVRLGDATATIAAPLVCAATTSPTVPVPKNRVEGTFGLTGNIMDDPRWVGHSVSLACKVGGVIMAMCFRTAVAGFYTSVRGAHILYQAATVTANKHGSQDVRNKLKKHRIVLVWAVAGLGFAHQLSNGFELPLMGKIALAPLVALESVLASLAGALSWGRLFA